MSTQPDKQPITGPIRAEIIKALETSGLSQAAFAKLLGKSEAYVSKLLSGGQKTMDGQTFENLEKALGKEFYCLVKNGNISPLASKFAELIDTDPQFAKLAVALLDTCAPGTARPLRVGRRSSKPKPPNTLRG